jgi:stearoyl-CoA desaturase (Delta-9 desaturase)
VDRARLGRPGAGVPGPPRDLEHQLVCHLWGLRPYRSGDQSRNNVVFGVLGLGEGWHNTHHAFPTSARHGLRWWQVDVSYYVIRALAWLGLARQVKVPSRQARAQARRV